MSIHKPCAHPGCHILARGGKLCPYHAICYAEGAKAKAVIAQEKANEKRRKQRLAAAIALCRKNGYAVETRHQPEAFPS